MRKDNLVITIGRQMGSGGRQVGRLLADSLGIDYYDKELLAAASSHAGIDKEFFEQADERAPSFLNSIIPFTLGMSPHSFYSGSTSISSDNIQRTQCELIASLPDRGPCVIVGRTADFVLRDHPKLVSVFISGSLDSRVARIMERDASLTKEKARTLAEKTDKLRANYYNFYTDKAWGASQAYNLCIDSTSLPPDKIAELIEAYIRLRFPA